MEPQNNNGDQNQAPQSAMPNEEVASAPAPAPELPAEAPQTEPSAMPTEQPAPATDQPAPAPTPSKKGFSPVVLVVVLVVIALAVAAYFALG